MESCKVPFCDLVFLGITKSKSHPVNPVCWFLVCLRGRTHSHVFAFGCDGTLTRQSSPSGPPRKAKMRLAPSPDANVLLPKVNGRRMLILRLCDSHLVFLVQEVTKYGREDGAGEDIDWT